MCVIEDTGSETYIFLFPVFRVIDKRVACNRDMREAVAIFF